MILSDGLFHVDGQKIHFDVTVESYFPISVLMSCFFVTIIFSGSFAIFVYLGYCVGGLEFVVHMP